MVLIFDKRTNCLLHIFEDGEQARNKARDLNIDGRDVRTELWYTSDKEKAPEVAPRELSAWERELARQGMGYPLGVKR